MSANAMVQQPGLRGVKTTKAVYYQLSVPQLVEHALRNHEGQLSDTGALMVQTGKYTGRSPNDRFFVDTSLVHDHIDWGKTNQPIAPQHFESILNKFQQYFSDKPLYVFDGIAGADHRYGLTVRFINEMAYENLFVHQLFIRPDDRALDSFQPEFTVMAAPGLLLNPVEDGVNSEVGIIINIEQKTVLIAGTQYCGELKKSIFTTLNYLMPDRHVFPMHCSANVDEAGRSALFFGLSGTGKTTLSADASRTLIGDDEHGWSETGIFNFEGGCYAKAIKLKQETEPEIFQAIRFGAIGENIVIDENTRHADYDDACLTENTRVGYPIDFIPHASTTGMAPHPKTVIFLTADAFGVLPPIARLTPQQAQYHFISGYTSKLAGTERGIVSPQATFSACFGAPFMPRTPATYAALLKDRLAHHNVRVFLINTGWQGGPYGVGQRMAIPYTRAMVNAALDGLLDDVSYWQHPVFNVSVPTQCSGVPDTVLNPKTAWSDPTAYDAQAHHLAEMFIANFKQFDGVADLVQWGPILNP